MNFNSEDSDLNTIWGHAEELRSTILKSISFIVVGFCLSLFFYTQIFDALKLPLNPKDFHHYSLRQEQIVNKTSLPKLFVLPKNATALHYSSNTSVKNDSTFEIGPSGYLVIDTLTKKHDLLILGPIEAMVTTLKVCFFVGLIASSPFWLYLILHFIAPAIDLKFYKLIVPFLISSLFFMGLGGFFAYFVTLPLANQYLTLFNEEIGLNLWSLSNYMDYTVILLIGNALSFEMAVIAIFLVHYGILSEIQLKEGRRYFIVAAFILSAILTPPDVFTQVMLAIPLIILYEFIILYAKFLNRQLFHVNVN